MHVRERRPATALASSGMERRGGASQGESLVTWAMWAVVLAIVFVTYWRLPPDTELRRTTCITSPGTASWAASRACSSS